MKKKGSSFTGAYKVVGIYPVTKENEELMRSASEASRTNRESTLPSPCPGNTGQFAQSDGTGNDRPGENSEIIAARVKLEGNKAVAHRLRQKPSNRRKSDCLKEKVLNLYRTKYSDFGPTFAAEKLSGRDKIKIGKETLRRWLIENGLHKKRRKLGKNN